MRNICGFVFVAYMFGTACGQSDVEVNSTEMIDSRIIYDVLSVEKIEQTQSNASLLDVEVVNDWIKISAMRATVKVLATCGSGNFELNDGSGMLLTGGKIITADHVIRGNDPSCHPTLPLPSSENRSLFLNFANDRYVEENGQLHLVDEKPPHLWLLKNRMHALSMFEAGAIENDITYVELFLLFNLISGEVDDDLSGNTNPALNRDIAYVSPSNASIFKIYSFFTEVPYGVFFDRVLLASNSNLLDTEDYGDEVIGVFNNRDPAKGQNGDWQVDFSPNSSPPIITPSSIKELVPMVSPGTLYEFNNFLNEPCFPESDYGKFCFSASIDASRGASGGGVLHRRNLFSNAYLVGILQSTSSGTDGDEWVNDLMVGDPPSITEGDPTCLGNCLLTRATIIDQDVLNRHPPIRSIDDSKQLYVPGIDNNNCYGSGCSNTNGNMILFSCLEGINDVGNPSNSVTFDPRGGANQSEWVNGYVVGFVGGPMVNGGDIGDVGDIEGIGSLGLVCARWVDGYAPYQRQWYNLDVVGLFRTHDLIVFDSTPKKVSNLVNIITRYPLRFSTGIDERVNPIPMKLCPPDHAVSGFTMWVKDDGSYFRGLKSIECSKINLMGGTGELFLDPSMAVSAQPDASEFVQYIGNPKGNLPSGFQEKSFSCPTNQFLSGIEIFVEDDTSTRDKSSLSGLNFECQNFN